MRCPECGDPGAECIINNYYHCPNRKCPNFDEKTPAEIHLEINAPDGAIATYECFACGNIEDYNVDYVAGGGRCAKMKSTPWFAIPCDGLLRIKY